MGLWDGISNSLGKWYEEQRGIKEATNLTAMKVNIEQAQDALEQLSVLLDEMEDANTSANGNIRRCWACVCEGLEGESQDVLLEQIDRWKSDQKRFYNGTRDHVKRIGELLEGLVESDQALANYIQNS